jgi:adenine/guanine phosphoribosyltransferase-like PRPP-binding protein
VSGPYSNRSDEETVALALNVVAWAVSDQTRAERILSLTGLDPQTLRENLTQPATLRAMLDFVLDHEPDLIACAAAIGVAPGEIAAARRSL